MIHSNGNLTVSDKFHYLRLHFTGLTASAIAGLPTASCYDGATKGMLGDIKQIQQIHLHRLRNLPHIKSADAVRGLRSLYDHVEVHTRSLQAVGVQPASYAAMLTEILKHSLPHDLAVEYNRRLYHRVNALSARTEPDSASAEEDQKDFMSFLKIDVECRGAEHQET